MTSKWRECTTGAWQYFLRNRYQRRMHTICGHFHAFSFLRLNWSVNDRPNMERRECYRRWHGRPAIATAAHFLVPSYKKSNKYWYAVSWMGTLSASSKNMNSTTDNAKYDDNKGALIGAAESIDCMCHIYTERQWLRLTKSNMMLCIWNRYEIADAYVGVHIKSDPLILLCMLRRTEKRVSTIFGSPECLPTSSPEIPKRNTFAAFIEIGRFPHKSNIHRNSGFIVSLSDERSTLAVNGHDFILTRVVFHAVQLLRLQLWLIHMYTVHNVRTFVGLFNVCSHRPLSCIQSV